MRKVLYDNEISLLMEIQYINNGVLLPKPNHIAIIEFSSIELPFGYKLL